MSKKISTVFIDIDQTLTDNFHIHTNGWKTILFYLGKEIEFDFFNTLHGDSTFSAIQKICVKCGVNMNDSDFDFLIKMKTLIRDYEVNKLNHNNLFPGVFNFLSSLRQNDVRIVCCAITSACHLILEKLEVSVFFDDYICGKNMIELKSTSPQCYFDYINKNNLKSSECLVIDDDINVLISLKNSKSDIHYLGFGNKSMYNENGVRNLTTYEQIEYEDLVEIIS